MVSILLAPEPTADETLPVQNLAFCCYAAVSWSEIRRLSFRTLSTTEWLKCVCFLSRARTFWRDYKQLMLGRWTSGPAAVSTDGKRWMGGCRKRCSPHTEFPARFSPSKTLQHPCIYSVQTTSLLALYAGCVPQVVLSRNFLSRSVRKKENCSFKKNPNICFLSRLSFSLLSAAFSCICWRFTSSSPDSAVMQYWSDHCQSCDKDLVISIAEPVVSEDVFHDSSAWACFSLNPSVCVFFDQLSLFFF